MFPDEAEASVLYAGLQNLFCFGILSSVPFRETEVSANLGAHNITYTSGSTKLLQTRIPRIPFVLTFQDPPTTLNWNLTVLIWWYLESNRG